VRRSKVKSKGHELHRAGQRPWPLISVPIGATKSSLAAATAAIRQWNIEGAATVEIILQTENTGGPCGQARWAVVF